MEREELNSLDALVQASIMEMAEVIINHLVDLPDQDIIHFRQQVVARHIPFFGERLDEPLRDDV